MQYFLICFIFLIFSGLCGAALSTNYANYTNSFFLWKSEVESVFCFDNQKNNFLRQYYSCNSFNSWTAQNKKVYFRRLIRGVAQLASVLAWGASGRKFESSHPDFFSKPFNIIIYERKIYKRPRVG